MPESIFSTFNISGQGMSAQRQRLSSVAKNIANIDSTRGHNGEPYKREITVIRSSEGNSFANEFQSRLSSNEVKVSMGNISPLSDNIGNEAILEVQTTTDNSSPRLVYDPSHPDADKNGYVHLPNINIVTEMVEMISAQRAFEANANVVESAKNLAHDSLDM